MSKANIFLISAFFSLLGTLLWGVRERAFTPAGMPTCYKEWVCDTAHMLKNMDLAKVEMYHKALLGTYDIDLRVLTGTMSPEQTLRYFKVSKVGELSKSRKGALLMIDPISGFVRYQITAGLDAVYTDAFVSYLERKQMVPFFQANQVVQGILATTEMIVTRAQEAAAGKEFIPVEQLPKNLAIGAGAETQVSIGSGYTAPQASANVTSDGLEKFTPLQIVELYHRTLEAGDTSYNLPIYSKETQKMRQSWVVTPAQMANELKAYKSCDVFKEVFLDNNARAAVLYKVDQRQCSPYFLIKEDGAWRLDFAEMMNYIRFNVSNEWHLDMNKPSPYAKAFEDWSFNKNGYPFPMQKMRWGMTIESDYRTRTTFIRKIYPDTPVSEMGLLENDIILQWDALENPVYRAVIKSMDELAEGTKFQVIIERNGQKITMDLVAPPKIN